MVLHSESSHTFPIPFSYLVQAHNLRYPSPYGKHILSSDVISRSFNPSTNVLKTTKLILKRGKVPRWAPRVIQRIDKTWVLEETEIEMGLVEPDGALLPADGGPDAGGMKRELRTRSRNIDRTEFMEVFEWQVFREKKGDPFSTEVTTLSRVTSEFGFWPLSQRIEKYGLSRLPRSIEGSRLGLQLIAELLLRPSTSSTILSSGPLAPFLFEPVPSQLSLAVRAKLDEARSAWLEGEQARRREAGVAGAEFRPEEEPRRLRLWRERWRAAVQRGRRRFREKVCVVTGFLCDEPGTVEGVAGSGEGTA
ncbi:hypothetical protein NBRC10512_008216 [Rhodotorula toruloides]|uniref:RHTO0S02e06414g1_1 n=2 Tax=Rhodotorula toruloides TaxID=5286 RepID=A0A061AGR0_RHOTO|nr:mitochondrial intermembrane space protein, Ups1 [Rhodotorula toruloides NP11]EMS19168.1 mitochondrial intermembrane space protein, Ups1 [Rhodotorula toruloides NP11]CDR36753.1 RHTO0S02e06414g1_1 [Rhodotorula toruloides]